MANAHFAFRLRNASNSVWQSKKICAEGAAENNPKFNFVQLPILAENVWICSDKTFIGHL